MFHEISAGLITRRRSMTENEPLEDRSSCPLRMGLPADMSLFPRAPSDGVFTAFIMTGCSRGPWDCQLSISG